VAVTGETVPSTTIVAVGSTTDKLVATGVTVPVTVCEATAVTPGIANVTTTGDTVPVATSVATAVGLTTVNDAVSGETVPSTTIAMVAVGSTTDSDVVTGDTVPVSVVSATGSKMIVFAAHASLTDEVAVPGFSV